MTLTIALLWYGVLTVATLAAYGYDKASASRGGWRIRESRLLWLAAAGGFVGAILGMSLFRHKTTKPAFRVIPWMAAVIHGAAWVLVGKG